MVRIKNLEKIRSKEEKKHEKITQKLKRIQAIETQKQELLKDIQRLRAERKESKRQIRLLKKDTLQLSKVFRFLSQIFKGLWDFIIDFGYTIRGY